jgi:cytochrome P450
VRLAAGITGEVIRHPLSFSVRTPFRAWLRRAVQRRGSENLVLNFGVKRILLVGGKELSKGILDAYPKPDGITMGEMKRKGMSVLAPHALTISDGPEWKRLRAFNEQALESGRPHQFERDFLGHVLTAFSEPIHDIDGIRAAMSRSMLGVVFGGKAPPSVAEDVQALFELVQNPIKRMISARSARRRRQRLYASLRNVWRDPSAARTASLLTAAHHAAEVGSPIDETILLEQVPHWMFTFTGSGTDLVARALTLILSDAGARRKVEAELVGAGPLGDPATIDRLNYVEACLVEGAQLFPPVTRTFHSAPKGASVNGVMLPPRMEVLHSFPLISSSDATEERRFRPERWMEHAKAPPGFDPFLGGARHCPGQSIIMRVGKAALAAMIGRQRLELDGVALRTESLPAEFPRRGIKFRPAQRTS